MVRQRATSRSSVQLVQAFVVFRILSVTSSLTHALSQSLAHAQQFFSGVHARPNISAEGLHFSAFHSVSRALSLESRASYKLQCMCIKSHLRQSFFLTESRSDAYVYTVTMCMTSFVY